MSVNQLYCVVLSGIGYVHNFSFTLLYTCIGTWYHLTDL